MLCWLPADPNGVHQVVTKDAIGTPPDYADEAMAGYSAGVQAVYKDYKGPVSEAVLLEWRTFNVGYVTRVSKKSGTIFGWEFFLISLGGQAPHVLRAHMGVHCTCGEPNEIESPATHGLFCRSFPGQPRVAR